MSISSNPSFPFQGNIPTDFFFNPTSDSFLDSFNPFDTEVQNESNLYLEQSNSTSSIKPRIISRESSNSDLNNPISVLGKRTFETMNDSSLSQTNNSPFDQTEIEQGFADSLFGADSFFDSFNHPTEVMNDETHVFPYPFTLEQSNSNSSAIKPRILLRESSSSNLDNLTSVIGIRTFEAMNEGSLTQTNSSASDQTQVDQMLMHEDLIETSSEERSLEDKEFFENLLELEKFIQQEFTELFDVIEEKTDQRDLTNPTSFANTKKSKRTLRISWLPEQEAFFKEIVPAVKNGNQIEFHEWDEIAKKMNERFNTNVFSGKNCRYKWNNENKQEAGPRRLRVWVKKKRVDALYEIVEQHRIFKGFRWVLDWEGIAKEMNERFKTNIFTHKNCRERWKHRKRDLKKTTTSV